MLRVESYTPVHGTGSTVRRRAVLRPVGVGLRHTASRAKAVATVHAGCPVTCVSPLQFNGRIVYLFKEKTEEAFRHKIQEIPPPAAPLTLSYTNGETDAHAAIAGEHTPHTQGVKA